MITHNTHRMRDIAPLFKAAAVESLNEVAEEAREMVGVEIAKVYNISADYVRTRTELSRASEHNMEAQLVIKARKLPLTAFGAVQTPSGVTVQIEKGKTTEYRGAFIATGKGSGQRNVFRRLLKSELARKRVSGSNIYGPRVPRLPMTKISFPSVAKIVSKVGLRARIRNFLDEQLPEVLAAKLNAKLHRT